MNYLAHLSRHFNFIEHFPASSRIVQAVTLVNQKHYRNVTLVREPHPQRDLPDRKDHAWISIKNDEGKEIGYCQYHPKIGQVGIFRMDDEYRHLGTGAKVLEMCVEDMKAAGATEIWGVTSAKEFSQMSKFQGKIHYRNPAHPSVTCDGYFMKL